MLSAALFTLLLSAPSQEMIIPEGTILPVVLNETVTTARLEENEPILFSLAEDIRSGYRTGVVLIPRGSHIVGRVEAAHRAGHFFGRSRLNIRVQEIITPTGDIYDGLSTKLIDIDKRKGKKGSVDANTDIRGPSHRGRDTLLLFFPPTTLFQLIVTPKRGPDVVLPVETRLRVKLMNPIYVTTPRRSDVKQ
jgi:type F conjugative transfer system protein TrbI